MDANTLDKYVALVENGSSMEPGLFTRYDVKRGLRNIDGTGVLVGLTRIGDVHGYIVDENEKVPVDGILRYRGINVFDLVEGFRRGKRFGFEETCFLLLLGRLPGSGELEEFSRILGEQRTLPESFKEDVILDLPGVNIMNLIARCVLAAYSFDETPEDHSVEHLLRQCIKLIAWFPTIAAYSYQAKRHYFDRKSLFLHRPERELGTAENLLRMIRPDGKYTQLEAETLDLALVLHAEHGGGNNSAFAIHVVSSSMTDTYSAIAAAIGSLKGDRHGGACLKVLQMMEEISANTPDTIEEGAVRAYLRKIMQKEAFDRTGLVYGIGHAVYTLSDPRAVMLKAQAMALAEDKGEVALFRLYEIVERLTPEVFKEVKGGDKTLCANVDFYSGFVYRLLGIPSDLFTPIFAISRVAGWCSHRLEEVLGGGRIIRPAYKCIEKQKNYHELDLR